MAATKKKEKNLGWGGASSRHITNLQQSIFYFDIYEANPYLFIYSSEEKDVEIEKLKKNILKFWQKKMQKTFLALQWRPLEFDKLEKNVPNLKTSAAIKQLVTRHLVEWQLAEWH